MPQPSWLSRDVAIVLPIDQARAIFARAEQYDIETGGRFDKRSACVLIWSTNAVASEGGEPVGAFWIRWHDPSDQQATIYRLEWDASAGGTEVEVRRALEVLAGRQLEAP